LYTHLSGETFLRKGSPPNPFPKTFNRILPPYRAHLKKMINSNFLVCALYGGKINSLGKQI
ncbi:MAG TPA: hypothetical protein PLH98_14880, partial [Ruminococcus flavefaciens]|nr:hypothetical protein [Ruminococcus flavefaciens]